MLGVDGGVSPVNHVFVKRVLDVGVVVRNTEQSQAVRLVVGEQERGCARSAGCGVRDETVAAECRMLGHDRPRLVGPYLRGRRIVAALTAVVPSVPEPERG